MRRGPRRLVRARDLALAVAVATLPLPGQTLNHVWVYVDTATQQAIGRSAVLAESVAVVREAQVSDGRTSWQGTYLFGKRTYAEFYPAGEGTPSAGTMALAIGADSWEEFTGIERRLRARYGSRLYRTLRTRVVGADTIPWFHQLELTPELGAPEPALTWWVMVYDSAHNARRWPESPAVRGRVDREAYLNALQPAGRAMPDVGRVQLVLEHSVARRVVQELKTVGLRAAGSHAVELRGQGFVLAIHPTADQWSVGVSAIEWDGVTARGALAGPLGQWHMEYRAGSLTMRPRNDCDGAVRVIPVEGAALHTCIEGAGKATVVFESGLGEGMSAWASLVDSVSRFARVVRYDRRGIGASPAADSLFDARRAVHDLGAVVNWHSADAPVVVVAHSLGAAYAIAFARGHPDRVKGLVLVDPTPAGFFVRQRAIIGERRFLENQATARARMRGTTRAEYEAMEASLAQAARGRQMQLEGALLSAGRVENPDTSVGRRAKAVWLELHTKLAERLGLRHQLVADVGHRLQDASPGVVTAAILQVVRSEGQRPRAP